MILVYYGNQLGVYLSTESILCHSYSLLSRTTKDSAVSVSELSNKAKCISLIFKNEFLPERDESVDGKI